MKSIFIFFYIIITFQSYASISSDSTLQIPLKLRYDSISRYNLNGLFIKEKNTSSFGLPKIAKSLKYYNIKAYIISSVDTLYFFTGLMNNDNRVLAVDVNYNKSFLDEKLYIFSPTSPKKDDFIQSEPIFINRGTSAKKELVSFTVLPYEPFFVEKSENESKISYSLLMKFRYSANICVKGVNYQINAFPGGLSKKKDGKEFREIEIINKKSPKSHCSFDYKKGLMRFDSLEYKIQSFSKYRDTLTLKYVGIYRDSTQVGNIISNASFYQPDSILIKTVQLHAYLKDTKYLLIDFWGWWCEPCIASIDELKSIKDNYAAKGLKILSIANIRDNKTIEIQKTTNIIKDKGMNWYHGIDYGKPTFIIDKLIITNYPNYILLDNSGRIIFKVIGTKKLNEKLEEFFKSK